MRALMPALTPMRVMGDDRHHAFPAGRMAANAN
jgi:hypothetical protein